MNNKNLKTQLQAMLISITLKIKLFVFCALLISSVNCQPSDDFKGQEQQEEEQQEQEEQEQKEEQQQEVESFTNLGISTNNRYLITEDSIPVYLLGGTAWTMPENCTREDVDFYLADRKSKGFNYVQIVASRDLSSSSISNAATTATMNPENKYGFRPFEWNDNKKADVSKPDTVEGGSPDNPNDYWDHLDYIIRKTQEMDMYVGLLPVWGTYYINNWKTDMILFDETSAKTYGNFLGNRYKSYRHIIWILGGDTPADQKYDARSIYRAMAEGIANGISGLTVNWNEEHPVWENIMLTYHGRKASAQFFNNDAWLRINMIYEDDPGLYENLSTYYNKTPVRPIIEGECWYEGYAHDGELKTAQLIRRQMYDVFIGGGLGGYVYGVASSSPGAGDQVLKFQTGWRDRLDLEGATQVKYLKGLLDQHEWWKWEPTQQTILDGKGEGETLKTACISTDGNELLVYFADNTSATIDLVKLTKSNQATATWYDPRNGNKQQGEVYSTNITPVFSPPEGWEDAVLILESK